MNSRPTPVLRSKTRTMKARSSSLRVCWEMPMPAPACERLRSLARRAWWPILPGIVLLALGGPFPALAGALGTCDNPPHFEGADVTTVVIQYTYAGHPNQQLSGAGRELALLIQEDALQNQLKYSK